MRESELVKDLAALCCIYEISYCWGPIEIIMQSSRVSNPTRAQGRFAWKLSIIS